MLYIFNQYLIIITKSNIHQYIKFITANKLSIGTLFNLLIMKQ
jgi:hypothetical protein